MWYSFNIADNLIIVTNLQTEDSVMVNITLNETCSSEEKIILESTLVNSKETFILPYIDGNYTITVERVTGNTIIESESYYYPYYNNLLNSIINEMYLYLCGDDCKECKDCDKNEKSVIDLLLKTISYYMLTIKSYPRFYEAIFDCLNCTILDMNNCILRDQTYFGNYQNKDLLERILSSFYLAFYYSEYYSVTELDRNIINDKYKYLKIIKCIKASNTDIECITNKITNNMGQFSTNFGQYINLPPSEVGDYSENAGNRATVDITMAKLTSLTTPPYSDPEGDAVQAMRVDTLPTNGAILKLNGVNVTVGQIILATDIVANKLKLIGPNQDALANAVFNFSLRDAGSMQFTS